MVWTIRPTAAAMNTINPGMITLTFTATDGSGNTVVEAASRENWTVEAEVAYRQDMLDRLKRQDVLKVRAASFLPTVQAYIAGNPSPISG